MWLYNQGTSWPFVWVSFSEWQLSYHGSDSSKAFSYQNERCNSLHCSTFFFLRISPESLPPFYDKLLPYLNSGFQTGWLTWILVWVFALDNKSFKIELFVWKILWVPLKKQRTDQNSIPQASLAGLCCAEVSFILRTGIRWRTLQTVDTLKKEMLTVPLSL